MTLCNRLTECLFVCALLISGVAIAAVPSPESQKIAVDTAGGCTSSNQFDIGGGRVRLYYEQKEFAASPEQLCQWVQRSAVAVSSYLGRFPVKAVQVEFEAVDSDKVRTGTTYGQSSLGIPLIVIKLGSKADVAALQRDWVMTHEFVHLMVPSLADRHHWLEEGIATYVEPVARVQRGDLDAHQIWGDMLKGMPKGLPQSGDEGLDRTHTWGRTYWGGALFCMLADIEIRERTGNRKGLQDALRGILAAGGSIEQDWPIKRLLEAGDHATGVPVLADLYAQLGAEAGSDDLQPLWNRIGVSPGADGAVFNNAAPLAAIREAITAPRS